MVVGMIFSKGGINKQLSILQNNRTTEKDFTGGELIEDTLKMIADVQIARNSPSIENKGGTGTVTINAK